MRPCFVTSELERAPRPIPDILCPNLFAYQDSSCLDYMIRVFLPPPNKTSTFRLFLNRIESIGSRLGGHLISVVAIGLMTRNSSWNWEAMLWIKSGCTFPQFKIQLSSHSQNHSSTVYRRLVVGEYSTWNRCRSHPAAQV